MGGKAVVVVSHGQFRTKLSGSTAVSCARCVPWATRTRRPVYIALPPFSSISEDLAVNDAECSLSTAVDLVFRIRYEMRSPDWQGGTSGRFGKLNLGLISDYDPKPYSYSARRLCGSLEDLPVQPLEYVGWRGSTPWVPLDDHKAWCTLWTKIARALHDTGKERLGA